MKVLQNPDMIVSCSLFSLCLSVLPSTTALRTFVVLTVQLLRTSKLLKNTNDTFDDARWMLTITRLAPEC
jgi:hypothetical protein